MWKLLCKALGALLVLYAGGALGWRRSGTAMRRVQMLEEMCAFLDALQNELHFRCGRTEELLASAQQAARLTALPLYFTDLHAGCGLQTELDGALNRTEREIMDVTRSEERALLRRSLEDLGGYPAKEEEQRLAWARERLKKTLTDAYSEAAQQCRLYRTIGLSLGGAAALLLL